MIPIDKNSPLPLYFQIKEKIIAQINSGDLVEGDTLPSENKLVEMYEVSRTTIRQAVDFLVSEGYLERRRGIGTFVTHPEPSFWDLAELRSFDDEAQRKQLITNTKVLEITEVSSNKQLDRAFSGRYEEFFQLVRLRYIENTPSELVTTYVPKEVAPTLNEYDFSTSSLFDVLRNKFNIRVTQAEKTFTAINASPEDAKLLEIKSSTAIQLVTTTTFDPTGLPIEFSIAKDRGLISKFKVRLTAK